MKHSRLAISLLTLSLINHGVTADTEFGDSVPLEVVQQLIGNPYSGQSILYSDVMDAFPVFTVPDDFEVLASADQGYIQRVILSTTLDEAAAAAALAETFAAASWVQVPLYGMAPQQTGFVSAEQPAVLPRQFCHDDHGTLTVMISAGQDKRYINITRNVGAPGIPMMRLSCADTITQATEGPGMMGMRAGNVLNAYVPKLLMPESNPVLAGPSRSFMGSGGSGSPNDWQTQATLALDWSISDLYAHFATQIAEQGWTVDAKATGLMVATGSWTKHIDDMDLVGTVAILKTADSVWDLQFRIVRQGEAQRGAARNDVIQSGARIVRDPIP